MAVKLVAVTICVYAAIRAALAAGNSTQCQDLAARGDCAFYQCLDSRLGGCGADGYPLGYGHRYCNRFHTTRNSFDARGQQWLDNVRVCLMSAITSSNVFRAPTQPSTLCEDIATLAFNSHPNCYTQHGFCDVVLNSVDCSNVCGLFETIDLRDLAWTKYARPSRNQIWETAKLCDLKEFTVNVAACTGQCITQRIARKVREFIITVKDYLVDCSGSSRLDLVFVLDASGSIGNTNFQSMKEYVINILLGFDDNTRVGAVTFSSSTHTSLSLTPASMSQTIASTIRNIPYYTGGTNTAAGITTAVSVLGQQQDSGVTKAMLVLTDGQSDNPASTQQAAQAAKAQGIQIYSVGIGSAVVQSELTSIASSPSSDYMLPIGNFSTAAFNEKIDPLRRSACRTPLPLCVEDCAAPRSLRENEASYFQFSSIPSEGLTVSVEAIEGQVGLYGSHTERNPNPLTAEYQTTGTGLLNIFVSHQQEGKVTKRSQEVEINNLFMSIISLHGNSTVNVTSHSGDASVFELISGPTSLEVVKGDDAHFSCTITGTGTLVFQWSLQKHGVVAVNEHTGQDGVNTTDTLYIENVNVSSSGAYWCTVSGEGKTAMSTSAILALQPLEIRGNERPLIVGLEPVIRCSTHLTVSKMEWLLVGFDFALNTSHTQEISLPLDLSSDGLDGAMFKCRATTSSGVYEETITIAVKELENVVSINAPQMPLTPGQSHTLYCVVYSDITPQVKWMGPDGSVLVGDDDVIIGDPVVMENGTVILPLNFSRLRTSQAGQYTCQSVVSTPLSVVADKQIITAQAPTPTVTVQRTPNASRIYTGSQIDITCQVELNGGTSVDTGVTVSTTWRGPSGVLTSGGRVSVSSPVLENGRYQSLLRIISLQSSDSGTYTCAAVVSPNPPSTYINASLSSSAQSNVVVDLKVTITIQYSPPAGVTLSPPNYRAATSVSLRCDAVGTTGSVSYQWSSTCGSSCFVSGSSRTVSRDKLWSYDAGQHTCTVTDGVGNTGKANIEMNVVGAGIYAASSLYSNSVPLSNNSAIVWRYGYSSSFRTFYSLYCMSNASSTSASVVYPYSSGYVYSSTCGAGCYWLYYNNRYTTLSSSYQGIHTCRIRDSRGIYLDVHVGIYQYGFSSAPVVTSLQRSTSTSRFTLICTSTTSPATTVVWTKDGTTLSFDGTPYQHSQVVTNRRFSTYNNILTSTGDSFGSYTCTVRNRFGSSSRSAVIRELGVTITIQYSPPAGVTLTPPNYQAATSVSLRCDAVGTSGSVTYQWSSTCGGSCFVRGSSQTVSRDKLWSYDAGWHTCVVTDGVGNTGRATTKMNIIGAGLYAQSSLYYNQIPLSNNSALVWRSSTSSYNEMDIYCMSNSTSYYTGSLLRPYGSALSRTSCGIGCYRAYSSSSSLSSSYQGIYTCRIADSRGISLDVNFGIYPYAYKYSLTPVVTSLYQSTSSSQFTLICTSTTSPATTVVWTKDGTTLSFDGTPYQHSQVVTNRRSSTYDNILTSNGDPSSAVGRFTCSVRNRFGTRSASIETNGLTITGSRNFTVGSNLTLTCTTDIDVSRSTIEWTWHRSSGTQKLVTSTGSGSALLELHPVTVSMHKTTFTCKATGTYGVQEKSIAVSVNLPAVWGTATIEPSISSQPTEGYEYTYLCSIVLNVDLEVTPELVWVGPDGDPVANSNNIVIGQTQTVGRETSLALNYVPLNSTHGGNYSCEVSVQVPYVNVTLSKVVRKILVVTSQASFQLKFGPVQHCIYWSKATADETNFAIRKTLQDAINDRCSCGFHIEAIFDGEFSCRTMKEHAVYRSTINGTSDKHTASELLEFIQDWKTTEGTFLLDLLRLSVDKCSPLRIQSFHQRECSGESTTPTRGSGGNEPRQSYIGGCFDKCLESECSSLSPA